MGFVLEIGPNLQSLGRLLGLVAILAYLIAQWWIISTMGKR